jgi:hypothetical protein
MRPPITEINVPRATLGEFFEESRPVSKSFETRMGAPSVSGFI